MSKNENFTPRAQKILSNVESESSKNGHHHLGAEHILLSLISDNSGIIQSVFEDLDINSEALYNSVLSVIPFEEYTPVKSKSDKPITKEFNEIIAISIKDAETSGQGYIGVEHLLSAILSYSKGAVGLFVESNKDLCSSILSNIQERTNINGVQSVGSGGKPANEEEGDAADKRTLAKYSIDLVDRALGGNMEPVIGRDKEVERAIQILLRKRKNNPILLGPAGVGKTAIVEGLARRIAAEEVPPQLLGKRIYSLDLTAMVSGARLRGDFEKRLKAVLDEVAEDPSAIVFIDEIHIIIGAGSGEGSMDACNILKPALARGEFPCIGATTNDEYRKHFENDSALERRFQPINVLEPTKSEAINILKGLQQSYGDFHGVKYSEEAIIGAVELSITYIRDRHLPDKAIDILDEAGAKAKLRTDPKSMKLGEKFTQAQYDLIEAAVKRQDAVENNDLELAKKCRREESKIESKMRRLIKKYEDEFAVTVTDDDVKSVVESWSKIPIKEESEDKVKLAKLEEKLGKTVIGQSEAISSVVKKLKKYKTCLREKNRPIGSFLFVGGSGVGKSLLAEEIAENVFDDNKSVKTFNMAEFSDSISTSTLIGTSAGYVGYDKGGSLTNHIRVSPHSVIVFDKIEYAHPNVIQLIEQIISNGKLTDNSGKTADFSNAIIIATTHIGSNSKKDKSMGFESLSNSANLYDRERSLEKINKSIGGNASDFFDSVVFFNPATKEFAKDILDKRIQELATKLGSKLSVSGDALDMLLEKGYNEESGAKNLNRIVSNLLEEKIVDKLLLNEIKSGDDMFFDIENGEIILK